MHPHTYYSTLFDFKKSDEVFVIMSFAPEFNRRWERVIQPAITNELNLAANRVDYNDSGESIVHDIMDGIAHLRLVLADITSSPMTDRRGQVWPQRNGNVMWELGIAHVMRLADEVIVVRSDNDPSIFDLTQFRAFPYDPDDDEIEGRRILVSLSRDRLRSVDQMRSDFVRRCAEALDPGAVSFLMGNVPVAGGSFPIAANSTAEGDRESVSNPLETQGVGHPSWRDPPRGRPESLRRKWPQDHRFRGGCKTPSAVELIWAMHSYAHDCSKWAS